MGKTTASPVTFTAGEALARAALVKIDSGDSVIYADAGEPGIGVTIAEAASGEAVAVCLLSEAGTLQGLAAAAITKNALVYPAADGKLSSTIAGNAVGIARETVTADGQVFEFLPLVGIPSGLVFGFKLASTADASGADQTLATLPVGIEILDYWTIARDTTAANITVKNGTNAIGAAIAKGTTNDGIVHASTLIAAYDTVAAGGTIKVGASADVDFDLCILAKRA